ncbi:hypothetical protein NOVO_07875 [Rickettsiales bacterium Ac37b]|nr:hypothetical protein NOVO_07875 [Rickettsiales bacterium Ac37b]
MLSVINTNAMTLDEIAERLTNNNYNSLDTVQLEALWQNYYNTNLKEIDKWAHAELEQDKFLNCTLFYPFSGPDVVHMMMLFPSCSSYIMIGLEPPGKILNLTIENINLDKLSQGIFSLLRRSFFITKDMWSDFGKPNHGVIIPIVVLLKKLQFNIISSEQIILTDEGNIEPNINGNGIKLQVKNSNKNFVQNIYYISTSLMNKNAMELFLKKQDAPLITYLKAAQYAFFDPRFIPMRNVILEKSRMVLQDDSGIPFRYFDKSWIKELYGQYAGPYGKSFKGYKQLDLLHAYSVNNTKPIKFRLGYGYGKVPSCLIKMVKQDIESKK